MTQLDEILALQRACEQRLTLLERDVGKLLKLVEAPAKSRSGTYESLQAEIATWFDAAVALNPAYAESSGVAFSRRFNKRIAALGAYGEVRKRLELDGTIAVVLCHDRSTLVVDGRYFHGLSADEQRALALPPEDRQKLRHLSQPSATPEKTAGSEKLLLDAHRDRLYNGFMAAGMPEIEAWEKAHNEVFNAKDSTL